MEYSIFKQKVENLKIPWIASISCIYCPITMNPNQGYVTVGKLWTDYKYEELLEDFYTEILNYNRTLKIHDGYVEVFIFKTKEYIKILC